MNEVKHKSISSTLEANIRNGVYEDKLPPVRSLSADFSVSTRTINKALKPLIQKGLVIPAGPRGNLIKRSRLTRTKTNIVGVFCSEESPDFLNDPLLSPLRKRAEDESFKAIFMSSPNPNDFDDEKFWTSNWVDGYIFVYSTIDKKLAYLLRKNDVPFVVANRLPPEYGAHWVDFNLESSLRTMIGFLANLGRSNIMLAFSDIHLHSYIEHLERTWATVGREYKGQTISASFHATGKDSDQRAQACAERFLAHEADALILYRTSPADVQFHLSNAGRQIDEDYSMAYSSHKIHDLVGNSPCMLTPYGKLADRTWEVFKSIIQDPELEPKNILIDEDFVLTSNQQ